MNKTFTIRASLQQDFGCLNKFKLNPVDRGNKNKPTEKKMRQSVGSQ